MEHWLESKTISLSDFFFFFIASGKLLSKRRFGGFLKQGFYKRKQINFSGHWIVFSGCITKASICDA